jgi:hypothetical protein
MFDVEMIYLADGREVPKPAVEALSKLESSWPGTTLPQARAAIVATVMQSLRDIGYIL